MEPVATHPVEEIKQVLATYLKELDRLKTEQEAVIAEFSAYLDKQQIASIEESLSQL
jgi:hypothetical protein